MQNDNENWREVTLIKRASEKYIARLKFSLNPPMIAASVDHRLMSGDRFKTEEGTEWEIISVENGGRWDYLQVRPYKAPPTASMQSLQESIGEWAERTFPNHTPESIALHLLSEAVELCTAAGCSFPDMNYVALKTWREHRDRKDRNIAVESADVTILALTLANHSGFSLAQTVIDKMAVNFKRKWKQDPDMLGLTRVHDDE